MKRTPKEFNKYVAGLRRVTPCYSNGRSVVVLSEYSKKGQAIIERASQYKGTELRHVYNTWSDEKQEAYDAVWQMYCNSRHGSAFGICSYNPRFFTVSWVSDEGVHYLTHLTEYLVVVNE